MTNQAHHPLPTDLKQAASSRLDTGPGHRQPAFPPPNSLDDAAPTNSLWPRQAATEACSISTAAKPITDASHIRSQRVLIADTGLVTSHHTTAGLPAPQQPHTPLPHPADLRASSHCRQSRVLARVRTATPFTPPLQLDVDPRQRALSDLPIANLRARD